MFLIFYIILIHLFGIYILNLNIAANEAVEEEERELWHKAHEHELPEKKSQHSRQKRSFSKERNVETLVVVDTKMVEYYKSENLETYVLTIMNMVGL